MYSDAQYILKQWSTEMLFLFKDTYKNNHLLFSKYIKPDILPIVIWESSLSGSKKNPHPSTTSLKVFTQ